MQGPVVALRPSHGAWRMLCLRLSVLSIDHTRRQCFDTTEDRTVHETAALPFIRHLLQHILLLPVSFLNPFPQAGVLPLTGDERDQHGVLR